MQQNQTVCFFSMGPVLFALNLQCAIPVSRHQKRWPNSDVHLDTLSYKDNATVKEANMVPDITIQLIGLIH